MSSGFYLTPSIIYLNLGCEMMFVLLTRMKAQKVDMEKYGNSRFSDLIHILFKKAFIDNILKPQVPISIPTFYELFNKIINSIIKMDSSSMEKLFYLILMTFKKQIFSCSSPLEIYSITINHMRELMKLTKDAQAKKLIEISINYFREVFQGYSFIQYLQIRQQILSMLESYHSRIVLFVETGFQTDKGIMIHVARNFHNKKAIGMGFNHSSIEFELPDNAIPERRCDLQAFLSWKTDLANDNYSDPRGSSKNYQNNKISKHFQNEKSMQDFLGLNNSNLTSFEIDLDIFTGSSKIISNDEEIKKEKVNEIVLERPNDILKKITQQFLEVETKKEQEEEEEELDLLQMMDS